MRTMKLLITEDENLSEILDSPDCRLYIALRLALRLNLHIALIVSLRSHNIGINHTLLKRLDNCLLFYIKNTTNPARLDV